MGRAVVYTIGHSTRSLDELVGLLEMHGVTVLADVRSLPGSRRVPHFDRESLERALPPRAIRYCHLKSLGGRRRAREDSPNLGWRNESFRGYADYMQTDAWRQALNDLLDLAKRERPAIMCAEAIPWRCHRSLIADGLSVRGVEVLHITGRSDAVPHRLTSFARIEEDRIIYPALDTLPLDG
jgi:uncharacterized protein (DUF488 family)